KSSVLKKQSNSNNSQHSQNSLNYLLNFLDAYDFASEGSEDIQEESKTLINASVLGLIFEKINGYRDGSIFTPGFITMYMCRESIRAAVVQKMNEHFGWACGNFDDVKNFTADKRAAKDVLELNSIVNSLRVCDPAVGSGHFLVSALNEIIAVKSGLHILADDAGVLLGRIDVNIENDELIITRDDGNFFSYEISNGIIPREAQRIQKTLFHEKQRIIENCLFGVDINPNSVKICRLRLWIELLKNAYYTEDSGFKNLETLPNIDINIKCGNSLVSRFALDMDLKKSLKKFEYSFKDYRTLVHEYVQARDKDTKRKLEDTLKLIKSQYGQELGTLDTRQIKYSVLKGQLHALDTEVGFVEPTPQQKKDIEKKRAKLEDDFKKAEAVKKELENNDGIYRNAFEWRFEFPEVLDDDGNFKGFDVVVGNPPYVMNQMNEHEKEFFKNTFKHSSGKPDLYRFFTELGHYILKENGLFYFIIPNSILATPSTTDLRKFLINSNTILQLTNFFGEVFEGVGVNSTLLYTKKTKPKNETIVVINDTENYPSADSLKAAIEAQSFLKISDIKKSAEYLINTFLKTEEISILEKLEKNPKLEKIASYTLGLQVYHNTMHSKSDIENRIYHSKEKIDESYIFESGGRNISRYGFNENFNEYVSYGEWCYNKPDIKFCKEERILIREITSKTGLVATITNSVHVPNKAVIIVICNKCSNHFLLSILNSKLIGFYINKITEKGEQRLFPRVSLTTIKNLPIPEIPATEQSPLSTLVEEILAKKQRGEETVELERRIDEMVYTLYDLTEEEIAVIEK
ncbi:MAG: TaqI-like C-terminal specificity domain-containing protein, partial [Bacteroidota bacterium]